MGTQSGWQHRLLSVPWNIQDLLYVAPNVVILASGKKHGRDIKSYTVYGTLAALTVLEAMSPGTYPTPE